MQVLRGKERGKKVNAVYHSSDKGRYFKQVVIFSPPNCIDFIEEGTKTLKIKVNLQDHPAVKRQSQGSHSNIP